MNYTLTDDDRKNLTLFIGECWHEWELYYSEEDKCTAFRCRNENCKLHNILLTPAGIGDVMDRKKQTFPTPSDQHAVFTKLVEVGKWEEFEHYLWNAYLNLDRYKNTSFILWNLESPERFCKLVSEYLKEEGK